MILLNFPGFIHIQQKKKKYPILKISQKKIILVLKFWLMRKSLTNKRKKLVFLLTKINLYIYILIIEVLI